MQINAVDLLKNVVQERNWHKGLIERRLAAVTKQNLNAGKLSYEKASQILKLIGYQKIKEETWQIKKNQKKEKNDQTFGNS